MERRPDSRWNAHSWPAKGLVRPISKAEDRHYAKARYSLRCNDSFSFQHVGDRLGRETASLAVVVAVMFELGRDPP